MLKNLRIDHGAGRSISLQLCNWPGRHVRHGEREFRVANPEGESVKFLSINHRRQRRAPVRSHEDAGLLTSEYEIYVCASSVCK